MYDIYQTIGYDKNDKKCDIDVLFTTEMYRGDSSIGESTGESYLVNIYRAVYADTNEEYDISSYKEKQLREEIENTINNSY